MLWVVYSDEPSNGQKGSPYVALNPPKSKRPRFLIFYSRQLDDGPIPKILRYPEKDAHSRNTAFSRIKMAERDSRKLLFFAALALGFARMFFGYGLRVLVLPQPSKRMPKMIQVGPFWEFNLGHEFGSDPNTFPLVLCRQTFAQTLCVFQSPYSSGRAKYKELRSVKSKAPSPAKTAPFPRPSVSQP